MSGGILYHSFLVSMSSRRINNYVRMGYLVLNYIVRLLTAVSDFDFRFEGRGSKYRRYINGFYYYMCINLLYYLSVLVTCSTTFLLFRQQSLTIIFYVCICDRK